MKYQVAGCTVDTALYRITREGGEVVPVEPKVFDLLVYLILHRDRVVPREELFQTVWDGREVSDATLSNHVMSARRLLGDSGERQASLQTVRGRGYQFIAPVTELGDAEPPPAAASTAAPPAEPEPPRRLSWPLWQRVLAGGTLVVAALLLGWKILAPDPAELSTRPFVVVVPFDVAAGGQVEGERFADQLTRDVIGKLRRISGLEVLDRPSAFTLKGNKSRPHIRALLPQAQYVLDGVISLSPDGTLRFTPELEDARSGLVVWGKPFAARIDERNFFEMASGIAEAVSVALKVEILKEERRALAEFPTHNPRAYAPYVAGWQQMEQFSAESLRRAIALFDEAVALDPAFFAAHLARSDAYRSLFAYIEPPIQLLDRVEASLAEALKLRPDSAEALASLGLAQVMAWRWQQAWDNLSRARAIDPTLALTELGFALYYTGLGEVDKVQRALAAANRLDPLNTELADWGNWALFMSGEREASRRWGEEKMRQHPGNGFVFCGAGLSAYIAGDTARGVALTERCAALTGRAPVALIMLAQAYGYDGRKDRVLPLLQEADAAGIYTCPYESAVAYLSIGERARALQLLGEAVEKRSNCLVFLNVDPRMQPLRSEPRFAELLALVGLDEKSRAAYAR